MSNKNVTISTTTPKWLVGPGADLPALERQLRGARDLHAAALAEEQEAVAAFDRDPTEVRRLTDARAAIPVSVEHIARAERMIETERARLDAERRDWLGERRLVLIDQTTDAFVDSAIAPLIDEEVRLLEQAAGARARRLERAAELDALARELKTIELQLGIDRPQGVHVVNGNVTTASPFPNPGDRASQERPVCERLKVLASTYPQRVINEMLAVDDPRKPYLMNLANSGLSHRR